jgi:hypothetical protein
MNVKLIAAVLVLLTALAGTAYGLRWALSALTDAKAQVHALETRVAAVEAQLAKVQRNVNQTVQRSQAHAQEIRQAVRVAPSWADAHVPTDITASLCKFANCKGSGVYAPTSKPDDK